MKGEVLKVREYLAEDGELGSCVLPNQEEQVLQWNVTVLQATGALKAATVVAGSLSRCDTILKGNYLGVCDDFVSLEIQEHDALDGQKLV